MSGDHGEWSLLRELVWHDVLLIVTAFIFSRILVYAIQKIVVNLAEKVPARWHLLVLRTLPFAKVLIGIGAAFVIIPMLIEPTFRNLAALMTSAGLALAFTLKDYGSSFAAGMTTVFENTYQPGDWIDRKSVV